MKKKTQNNWEKLYDKGINKILAENELPATASFLVVFSKSFISQLLKAQREEIIKEIGESLSDNMGQKLNDAGFSLQDTIKVANIIWEEIKTLK